MKFTPDQIAKALYNDHDKVHSHCKELARALQTKRELEHEHKLRKEATWHDLLQGKEIPKQALIGHAKLEADLTDAQRRVVDVRRYLQEALQEANLTCSQRTKRNREWLHQESTVEETAESSGAVLAVVNPAAEIELDDSQETVQEWIRKGNEEEGDETL